MGYNSCQPKGLQPKPALTLSAGLTIFAICSAPSFASAPILAATHTCFIMLGAPETLLSPLAFPGRAMNPGAGYKFRRALRH